MSDTRTFSYLLPPPSMAEASRRWFCCVVAEASLVSHLCRHTRIAGCVV